MDERRKEIMKSEENFILNGDKKLANNSVRVSQWINLVVAILLNIKETDKVNEISPDLLKYLIYNI